MVLGEGREDFLRLVTYYHGLDREGANFYHHIALEEVLLSRMSYLKELREMNLSTDEYVIFGSGPMAVRGIRPNNDIDVVVSGRVWESFGVCSNPRKIKKGHIEICRDWLPYFRDISVLLDNSETIGDFRYVKLPYVLQWKEKSKKPKDKKDAVLIREYLSLWDW